MKPRFLVYDNLDDRREIHTLLAKLSPQNRKRWLGWCCRQATLGKSRFRPGVARKTEGHAIEIFFDFWLLVSQFEVDVDVCVAKLAELAKVPKDVRLVCPLADRG